MKSRISFSGFLLVLWMTLFASAQAETIVLAVPGPGTLSYLPVYLAKAIAADQSARPPAPVHSVPWGI
ncbi:MAG: hypothetical protein WA635_04435 [Gallionella sp.]